MKRPSEVIFVTDRLEGGAGRAASRLFSGLIEGGIEAQLWHFSNDVWSGPGTARSLDPLPTRPGWERLLKNFSKEMANRLRHRRHTLAFLKAVAPCRPRLIHLHNLHASGINHASLMHLPKQIAIAWTLHDCWAFDPFPFRWFDGGLGQFAQITTDEIRLAEGGRRRESFFAARADVLLVGPSRWICSAAKSVLGAPIQTRHIPYGINLNHFSPREKQLCRRELRLDGNRFWIGCAAFSAHRRKGIDVLAQAAGSLPFDKVGLLLWGDNSGLAWPPGLPIRDFGQITDTQRLNTLYSACDLFVCPSRMDNFPLTMLESMAAGTATVASNRGGTGEAVQSGFTGEMFEGEDAQALSAVLVGIMQHADTNLMGRQARARVEHRFASGQEAVAWERAYDELTSNARPDARRLREKQSAELEPQEPAD